MAIEAGTTASRQQRGQSITESREELRRFLQQEVVQRAQQDTFPRSQTMRFLKSNKAIGIAAAVAGGVLLAKPRWAAKVMRVLPVNTLVRILTARLISSRLSRM